MLKVHDLIPYQSLLVVRPKRGRCDETVLGVILRGVTDMLDVGPSGQRVLQQFSAVEHRGDLIVVFAHYRERRRTNWTLNSEVVDEVNHLVLAATRGSHVALYFSDPQRRRSCANAIRKGLVQVADGLSLVSPGILNAAFVSGRVTTLWLSGIHRRVSVKADNKVLSGLDLRDALDPLGDQTYHFTAARCAATGVGLTVGTSPDGSRVWAGATRRWENFEDATDALLARLDGVRSPKRMPLPVVAVAAGSLGEVANAFDVALVPPELNPDNVTVGSAERERLADIAEATSFEILNRQGMDFSAAVRHGGHDLGDIEIAFDAQGVDRIRWNVGGTAAATEVQDRHAEVLAACRERSWLKVWYDSGHTLADGSLFEVRHRDLPFSGFEWIRFGTTDVTKEKPDPLAAIGTQDSLFCWVQRAWPPRSLGRARHRGWLACDDGAMEIADFIHLDMASRAPTISLIHVKGAGSSSPNRPVSVSKYEVVVGQAVKNLRFLDRLFLDEGLRDGLKKRIGSLVWRSGKRSTRPAMLRAMASLGTIMNRRVVIVQPQLTRRAHDEARRKAKGPEIARLRQLDTLLLGAENACRGLGAELVVLAGG
jgi:hypothetical protein